MKRFSTKKRNKFSEETEEELELEPAIAAAAKPKQEKKRETRVNDDDPKAPNPTTRENDDDRIYPKGTYKQGCTPVCLRFRQSNKYQILLTLIQSK
jgi:hypothetical protein